MPLKHAVLALIVERRGYGYELVQRFEERVGPGWRLNPSAIYPALDQLERRGLVTSMVRPGGTQRSPRVVYAATEEGATELDRWLRTPDAPPEPVRADLHLRIAFGRDADRDALAAQLADHERACAELLAQYPRARPVGAHDTAAALVDDAVVTRLRGELAWAERARTAVDRDRD